MPTDTYGVVADDFARARQKEVFGAILALLTNEKDDLLSLEGIKAIVRPGSESYRGIKPIRLERIVGSEGRYRDFNRRFLPRNKHLRTRWMNIGIAHKKEIELPAIRVYELGGVYFVRDGNHRVSVARMYGKEFIDAEITQLDSRISLSPDMSEDDIKRKVIEFEKRQFNECTRFDQLRPGYRMDFTAPGRYDEVCRHIQGHMRHMSVGTGREVSFEEAMLSWYDTLYEPIVRMIREEKALLHCPNRTPADLYVWIIRHWDEVEKRYGRPVSLREAVRDYADRHAERRLGKTVAFFRRIFSPPSDCP